MVVWGYANTHLASSAVTVLATAWDRGRAWGSGVAYDLRPVVSLGSVFGLENRTHKLSPGHCRGSLDGLVGLKVKGRASWVVNERFDGKREVV